MTATAYMKNSKNMSEIPDGSVQLVITTPSEPGPAKPMFVKVMREVKRILKPDGFFILNVGTPTGESPFKVNPSLHPFTCALRVYKITGFRFVWSVIGVFTDEAAKFPVVFDPEKTLANQYENWFLFSPTKDYRLRMLSGDVLLYPAVMFEADEGALEWMMRMTTDEGDLVVDPFAGTGTTARVALRLGRKAILYEWNPEMEERIRLKVPEIKIVKL